MFQTVEYNVCHKNTLLQETFKHIYFVSYFNSIALDKKIPSLYINGRPLKIKTLFISEYFSNRLVSVNTTYLWFSFMNNVMLVILIHNSVETPIELTAFDQMSCKLIENEAPSQVVNSGVLLNPTKTYQSAHVLLD